MHEKSKPAAKKEDSLGSTESLRWIGGTLVATLNVAVSVVGARLLFVAQSGFGESDFSAILFWTVPLAVLQGLLFVILVPRLLASSLPKRFAMGLVAGIVGATAWTIFIAYFLFGPMYGAFSISPGRVWLVAGPSSITVGVALLTLLQTIRGFHQSPFALLVSLFFPLLVTFLLFQVLVYGAGLEAFIDPNVTFIAVKWEPAEGSLQIDDPLPALTAAEVAQLHSLETGGRMIVSGPSTRGTPSRRETVRMIVVMHEPLIETIRLPVPKRENVMYVQELSGEWKQFPPDLAMTGSDVRVEPGRYQGMPSVEFWLEMDSSMSLVGLLSWEEEPRND